MTDFGQTMTRIVDVTIDIATILKAVFNAVSNGDIKRADEILSGELKTSIARDAARIRALHKFGED